MKIITSLLIFMSFQVMAHDTVEQNSCSMPRSSAPTASNMEREIFQAELVIYEKCMFDYIRDQQRQAEAHESAAQIALEAWNDYLIKRFQ